MILNLTARRIYRKSVIMATRKNDLPFLENVFVIAFEACLPYCLIHCFVNFRMTTFADMGLCPPILTALDGLGFGKPTPIQEKTIPHLLNTDRDLIALAQTGTGKTAAFCLPVLQKLNAQASNVQAVILCPTRELCLQIERDIQSFIKFMKGLSVAAIYGGDSMTKQMRFLAQMRPQIIVGTPGRVNDFITRKKIDVSTVNFLILDEADEMLNMGFKEELDNILSTMPAFRQTLLFSATMAASVAAIARKYMRTPERIETAGSQKGADNVLHYYYVVHASDRYEALRRIADSNPQIYGLIFCRTRRETAEVADRLMKDHYGAEPLHGDMAQSQREQVMDRFRRKQTRLLVATDVAARGIDVNELTHVINYQLPDQLEVYIHRSGRTGRANNSGIAISIINMREQHFIRSLERALSKKFEQCQIPTGKEICEKQLFALIDKVKQVKLNEEEIGNFLPAIESKLAELSREELVKRFVSLEFNRFLESYGKAPDLNVKSIGGGRSFGGGSGFAGGTRGGSYRSGGAGRGFGGSAAGRDFGGFGSGNFATMVIGLGRRDGFDKRRLFEMVNREPKLRGVEIGRINVGNTETSFELDSGALDTAKSVFANIKGSGKPMGGGFSSTGRNLHGGGYAPRRRSGGGSHYAGRGGSRGYAGGQSQRRWR